MNLKEAIEWCKKNPQAVLEGESGLYRDICEGGFYCLMGDGKWEQAIDIRPLSLDFWPPKAPGASADPKAKNGATKPSLALVPAIAIAHCAMAMEDGAAKYGPYNWRSSGGVESMTYLNAAMRHLHAFLDGEQNTSDTNVSNLGAAMACCAILLDAESVGKLIDNRPPAGKATEVHNAIQAQKKAATK